MRVAARRIARSRGCDADQFVFVDNATAGCNAVLSPRTRLLMVDHITSQTALVLPLAEIAAVCRRRGIAVLADGAHAPGAIELDIESLGVDFYVANLHKWWWAPRACGFVWVAKSRVTQLRPTVLSSGYRNGRAAEFDLPGTRDPSNCLAAPHAVDLWQRWGGKKILDYTHALVLCSAARLSKGWGRDRGADPCRPQRFELPHPCADLQ